MSDRKEIRDASEPVSESIDPVTVDFFQGRPRALWITALALSVVIVAAGIGAIMNFAPVHLHVPEGVAVKYEDLAVSLAELCGECAGNQI